MWKLTNWSIRTSKVLNIRLLYLILAFFHGIRVSHAQNCVFPSGQVRMMKIEENAGPGVLETIRVANVRNSDSHEKLRCSNGGPDAALLQISTSREDSEMRITLLTSPEPWIDQQKLTECEVVTKIPCTDKRKKEIRLVFPLGDLNTKKPQFPDTVELIIQPPWDCKVPLNFDQEIVVRDADRDLANAEIRFETDRTSELKLKGKVRKWLKNPEDGAHTFLIDLYLESMYCLNYGLKLREQHETTIFIHNAAQLLDPSQPAAALKVLVFFKMPLKLFNKPPAFTELIYRIPLTYDEWEEGLSVSIISATDEEGDPLVYRIIPTSRYININAYSGELFLMEKPTLIDVACLDNQLEIIPIEVREQSYENVGRAHLLLMFKIDDTTELPQCSSGGTENPITEPTTPPERFCDYDGMKPDLDFCNVFHHCQPSEDGGIDDVRKCCQYAGAEFLVFCEITQRCETQEDAAEAGCPCPMAAYDDSCTPTTTLPEETTPPSTGTTVEPYEPTEPSEPNPEPFECTAPGHWRDTEHCNVFHYCVDLGDGQHFYDFPSCCPYAGPGADFLVFCERSNQCETQEHAADIGCLCPLDAYDETCIPTAPPTDEPTLGPSPTEEPTLGPSEPSEPSVPDPEPFECTAPGEWRDTKYCNVFHYCIHHEAGHGYDDVAACCGSAGIGKYLVFCEEAQSCNYRDYTVGADCYCAADNFDTSCP